MRHLAIAIGLIGLAGAPSLPGADTPETIRVSDFTFKIPAGWESVPVQSRMRKAQLKVSKGEASAEVVFFYFGPSGAGTAKANVDRWLGQFQEPREKLNAKIEKAAHDNYQATFVQGEGTYLSGMPRGTRTPKPDSMLLGAIVEGGTSGPAYVRMTGPKDLVTAVAKDFRQMINSALKAAAKRE